MKSAPSAEPKVSSKDREILRSLAGRVREIAELPEQATRKRRLANHNALQPERPIILAFPEGAWVELLPDSSMQCEDQTLRGWEKGLRQKIYWWDHLRDDNAIEPFFNIGWKIDRGNYGFDIAYEHGDNRGSYHWVAPIQEIDADFDRLKPATFAVDREKTFADVALATDVFGDLLPARIRGSYFWTSGLTWEAIKLIGLETLMFAPYDQPEGLHRLLGFLRDEHLRFLTWMESEKLLSDSNQDDYVGSGGVAYTDELSQPGRNPAEPVRLMDRWGFAESQETVGISPEMFNEFILPYQLPLLAQFGLTCYGCCEGLHDRIDSILKVPNLRRVSVSPWCDQKIMADKLGRNYVFSRKPNPTQICLTFNEAAIRNDLATTLALAGEGSLEIIMKDTATIQNEPWRISRWIQIALEEVEKYAGLQHHNAPPARPTSEK
jgi:hypothetical protein